MQEFLDQDKILYRKFLNGDKTAFEEIILKHRNNLVYFIFKYVKDKDIAEDIFQDVALYLIERKEVYDFKYSFKTFLYMVAKSKALNYLRDNKNNLLFDKEKNLYVEEKMLEDMSYRGYTKNTKDTYIGNVKVFMRYYAKPIEELTEKDILGFMKYLSEERKLKNRTVNIYNSSIRFMYEVTLDKKLNFKQIPLFKVRRKIPDMLTKEEIKTIFDNCKNLKHRAMFMTIYGGGLRVTELVRLREKDIDSKEMRIFIKDGKGERDRYTILSDENLKILREYYLKYKPKNPEGYLFPSDNKSKKAYADRNAV